MQADALTAFAAMAKAATPGAEIIGPDSGYLRAQQWDTALLTAIAAVKPKLLKGVTHHVYDGINRANWNNPSTYDAPLPEIAWYTSMVRSLVPDSQIWAGENGPIGGGNDGTCGSNSVCGTFVSSIWYADDMSLRAKYGFHHHQRQDFFGGAYGLTSSVSGAMALGQTDAILLRPDFWMSFLHKRTLGLQILNASSSSRSVRAYAFAGAPPSRFAAPACAAAAATQFLLINLSADAVTAALPLTVGTSFASWTLAAGADGVFGSGATLNAVALPAEVDVRARDPSAFLEGIVAPPVIGKVAAGVVLPPQATTFVCVK